MARSLLIALAVIAVTCVSGPAFGQAKGELSREEKQALLEHLKEANEAFDAGEFATACTAYEEANEITELMQTWYRLGLCHAKLGNRKRAIDAYRKFLEMEPDARDRGRVTKEIERLKAELRAARTAKVRIATEPKGALVLTAEGEELGEAPVQAEMSPGETTFVARKEGYYDARRKIRLEGGGSTDITLTLQKVTMLEVTTEPSGALVRLGGPEGESLGETPLKVRREPGDYELYIEHDAGPPTRRTATLKKGERVGVHVDLREESTDLETAGWITLGTGGAGIIAAVVLRQLAQGKIDDANSYDRSDPDHSRAKLVEIEDDAETLKTATWIASGTAAAALVTGAVLLTLDWTAESDSGVAFTITEEGAHVFTTFRF